MRGVRRLHPLSGAFAAAAAVLALSACGDTSEPADDAEGAEEAGSPSADGCADGAGETVTVDIPEFAFEPEPVTVSACDEVVWSNSHDQPHTSTGKGDQAWSTGNIAPGESSEPVRFEAAGTFSYICALHPFMTGTVEVS